MENIKVKILAYNGLLVICPINPLEGIDEDWNPIKDGHICSIIKNTAIKLAVSEEALKLMELIKRGGDVIGDIDWHIHNVKAESIEHTFIWFGPLYRVLDPKTAIAARTFNIYRGACVIIPNDVSDTIAKKVDKISGLNTSAWDWPYSTSTKYHQRNVYIASPYSHDDKNIVQQRMKISSEICANLISLEVNAISPVVYGCALLEHGNMKDDSWSYWQKLCESILSVCEAMYIINIEGWDTSIGIGQEMVFAAIHKIPVFLIDPSTLEITKITAKLPLYKMSEEDVKAIADIYGVKYSHHDSHYYRDPQEVITVYSSSHGMASLHIDKNGKIYKDRILNGMEDLLDGMETRMRELAKGDEEKLKNVDEFIKDNGTKEERRFKKIEANKILAKYSYQQN